MDEKQSVLISDAHVPPQFCQYASGPCDQDFGTAFSSNALFLFPSQTDAVSATIEDAVVNLRRIAGDKHWITWKTLDVPGQILFREICKAVRFTSLVVADVTTLNFSLLFEIGYALGLGIAVLPIRDTSNIRDAKQFEELGILDTFAYFDRRNSLELRDGVLARTGTVPLSVRPPVINAERPARSGRRRL